MIFDCKKCHQTLIVELPQKTPVAILPCPGCGTMITVHKRPDPDASSYSDFVKECQQAKVDAESRRLLDIEDLKIEAELESKYLIGSSKFDLGETRSGRTKSDSTATTHMKSYSSVYKCHSDWIYDFYQHRLITIYDGRTGRDWDPDRPDEEE